MWKCALLALALVAGTGGVPALATPSIAGVGDVRVVTVRYIPSPGATYVLANVELTNDTTHDFTPSVSRFFLTGTANQRYQGTDSGSSVFAGISNSQRMLKQGGKRNYTVGFRSPDPVITGTVSYEP